MTSYPISTAAIEYYTDAREQFEHLLGRLMHEETQGMMHGEVETLVKAEGGELLRRVIQGYFDQRSAEEPIRERVVGEDGIGEDSSTRRLQTGAGDPLRGSDRHPPGLRGAWPGECLPPGCGAESAAGQALARTAGGADRGGGSGIV